MNTTKANPLLVLQEINKCTIYVLRLFAKQDVGANSNKRRWRANHRDGRIDGRYTFMCGLIWYNCYI